MQNKRKHYNFYTDENLDGLIENLIYEEEKTHLHFYNKKYNFSLMIQVEKWNYLKIVKLLKQNKFKFKKYLDGFVVFLDNNLKVLIYPENKCGCCAIKGKKHFMVSSVGWAFKKNKKD